MGTTTTTSAAPRDRNKFFCFTVMRAHAQHEVDLMRVKLHLGAGIFACDEWRVFSDTKMILSPGSPDSPVPIENTVIATDLRATGNGITTQFKNSKQFLSAWDKMREDGSYKDSDWVVKVDPDTLFFPDRLRAQLKQRREDPSQPTFFANCKTEARPIFLFEDEERKQEHFMFGAVEVFSIAAVEAFFERGDRCNSFLRPDDSWEERYLSKCLLHIGVHMETFPDLLEDNRCNGGKPLLPCTAKAVAFHPLRKLNDYQTCIMGALGLEEEGRAAGVVEDLVQVLK